MARHDQNTQRRPANPKSQQTQRKPRGFYPQNHLTAVSLCLTKKAQHKVMTRKVTLFSTFLLPALRGLQCVLHGQFNIKWSQLSSLWKVVPIYGLISPQFCLLLELSQRADVCPDQDTSPRYVLMATVLVAALDPEPTRCRLPLGPWRLQSTWESV